MAWTRPDLPSWYAACLCHAHESCLGSLPAEMGTMTHARVQVSGFLPWDARFADELAAARVATPSLFIHGEADALIPLERCEELRATFAPSAHVLLTHPGGHFVPSCAGPVKQRLLEFLDRF